MAKFIVEKSGPLKGSIKASGAKNAVLPIMAASILATDKCYLVYDEDGYLTCMACHNRGEECLLNTKKEEEIIQKEVIIRQKYEKNY